MGGAVTRWTSDRTGIEYLFNSTLATWDDADASCRAGGNTLIAYFQDVEQVCLRSFGNGGGEEEECSPAG